MAEIWKSVVGWEGYYEVSDLGRVRSLDRIATDGSRRKGKILKGGLCPGVVPLEKRYWKVVLSRAGKTTNAQVHTLVLVSFTGPKPIGKEARHIDGNSQNARLSNLEWGSPAQNGQDRIAHGTQYRGEGSPMAKLTEENVLEIRRLAASGVRSSKIAKYFGVGFRHINAIKRRDSWGWL